MKAPLPSVHSHPADPLHVLLEASSRLLKLRDVASRLAEILDVARQVIDADAYAVWRTYDGGESWRILMDQGLSEHYRKELLEQQPSLFLEPLVFPDVYAHPMLAAYGAAYRREGICSILAVPMVMEGQGSGFITFYYRCPHAFTETDVKYATTLANLSSSALYTSELHEKNQREKQRLAFLADASSVLASSLDYEATLERVAQLAVQQIADWCTVHILEDGVVTRLTVAHTDPAMLSLAEQLARLYPERIQQDRGVGKVLRTGQSELYRHVPDHLLVEAAQDEEHLRLIRQLGITSGIIVALQARGQILGAIRLIAAQPERNFDEYDLQLAEDLARRAAVAIENARLYRELGTNEHRLRLSHAAAKMGSWNWDLVRKKMRWSEEFKRLHRISLDAVPGEEGGTSLIHPDDREQVLSELQQILASDAVELSMEHRAVAGDGSLLWVHSRGRIERAADGSAVSIAGISMDVTERRQTEEALRRTEKLAAAGRLAATVAHEINNPLEALTNLVYLAEQAEGLPAEARDHLGMAREELRRVEHISKQTLGFYRESVGPKAADLRPIILEVLDLYRRRIATKGVRLIQRLDAPATATVVSGEIRQVIANLVSNAIDATKSGGAIEVEARSLPDGVEIEVSDSGTGIPEPDRERLFEPFFTTKADVGTGLGLWVSKSIIEKHRGAIRFESSQAQGESGTRFLITLPA